MSDDGEQEIGKDKSTGQTTDQTYLIDLVYKIGENNETQHN